jgi:putative phosphoesterase
MRILVLSDIHANRTALEEIDESFDACVCLGDLVDYGTDPVPVVEWAIARTKIVVRGNHDHAVAQRVRARGGRGFRELAALTRPLMWDLLTPRHLKYLSRMPLTRKIELDGLRMCLVHATPRDPLDEYVTTGAEGWTSHLESLTDVDLLLTGHTHVQGLYETPAGRVLNPGSVGQPRDGDPRAAYAIIDNGRIELKRVAYDIDLAVARMREQGVPRRTVELNEAVWRSGGTLPDADVD